MGSWGWLDTRIVDMGPYLRRRGLVFVDGKPLEPMEQLRELAMAKLPPVPDFTKPPVPLLGMPPRRRGGPIMQEIGGSPDARFSVDDSGTAIHVRLASGTPADHMIEITTRQHTFIPAHSGISYIRVKGITFQHAGNPYPFPQFGMVSLAGGDHWILEDNTFEWANGGGLDIGSDGNSAGAPHPGASQILRRNTFRYCGIEGIGGMGTTNTLVEDNLIEWCGWADAERGWEAAGAKFHRAKNMLFRRNVIRHMRHANAAWWDVDNVNCRITKNIFADVLTVGAAVHMEMNPGQNSHRQQYHLGCSQRRARHARPARMRGIGHFRQCHRQSHHRAEPDRPLRQCRHFRHHPAGPQYQDPRVRQQCRQQHLRQMQIRHQLPQYRQPGGWECLCRHARAVSGPVRRRSAAGL